MKATTVVYYDVDTISDRDLDAVHGVVPERSVLHAHKADVAIPPRAQTSSIAVPNDRDAGYRHDLARMLKSWCGEIHKHEQWRRALHRYGVDLLEVAFGDWLEALAPHLHKLWVHALLTRSHPGTHILWVGPQEPRHRAHAVTTKAYARHLQTIGDAVREGKGVVRDTLSFLEFGLHYRPSAIPRPAGSHGRVLFVEHFSNSSRIAATAAAALDGADYRFIATRPAVCEVAQEYCRTELLSHVVPPWVWTREAPQLLRLSMIARAISRWGIQQSLVLGAHGRLVAHRVTWETARTWRRAALSVAAWRYVLDSIDPNVVVSTSFAGVHARSAMALARRRRLPAFAIQHGITYAYDFDVGLVNDHALVWGQRDKRDWANAGLSLDSVAVTGSPKFDIVKSKPTPVQSSLVFRVAFLPSRTGGSSVSLATALKMRDAVVGAVHALAGGVLVIKQHPADMSELFAGLDACVIRTGSALDTMRDAALVIAATSTSGFEACALDKPLVVLQFDDVELHAAYHDYGSALIVHDAQELREALVLVRQDQDTQDRLRRGRAAMIADMFDGLRPGATQRIAEALTSAARAQHAQRHPVP